MSLNDITNDTLQKLRGARSADGKTIEEMVKAWTAPTGATTGIQNYDLDPTLLKLIPVITPLVDETPVVGARGGIQANWKALTGINTTGLSPGVGEGNRSGVITSTTADYNAVYKGFGLEDSITYEAEYAAEDYIELLSLGQADLLWAYKIAKEAVLLGGQGTYGLGQATAPTLAASTSGGTLPTMTLSVIVAALTLDGFLNATVAAGVRGAVSRTNADGSTDTYGGGTGKLSANTTVGVTGATGSATATTPAVTGAVGYAWFWGTAGSEVLGAITTINSVAITAAATGTQTASSLGTNDNSQNNLVCDGLLAMIAKSGFNGYWSAQPTGTAGTGTPLTADTEGGIVEFDAALKHWWDVYRLTPHAIYVSSQEMTNIHKKILQGGTNTATRFVFTADAKGITGGMMVRSYLNKFGMNGSTEIPIQLHPNMPAGTVLFRTKQLPYPGNNAGRLLQFRARKPLYATLWPQRSRKYEFGVYEDGVLQNKAPFAFGAITNIGNG